MKMRCVVRSLLGCCALLLLAEVRATYPHRDLQLAAAQTRGRPPHRTLNPASKTCSDFLSTFRQF